jgi:hypothetical protein
MAGDAQSLQIADHVVEWILVPVVYMQLPYLPANLAGTLHRRVRLGARVAQTRYHFARLAHRHAFLVAVFPPSEV